MVTSDGYNEFPTIVVGGPTGNYFVECPVTSCRWAEFQVVTVANGNANAQAFVTGDNDIPAQLAYDGSKQLTDGATLRGIAFSLLPNTTQLGLNNWDRITHSQKRVMVRIDNGGATSTYVAIKFRAKMITVVPAPPETVHPELSQQVNIKRADTIKSRLAKAGIPESAVEHGS